MIYINAIPARVSRSVAIIDFSLFFFAATVDLDAAAFFADAVDLVAFFFAVVDFVVLRPAVEAERAGVFFVFFIGVAITLLPFLKVFLFFQLDRQGLTKMHHD